MRGYRISYRLEGEHYMASTVFATFAQAVDAMHNLNPAHISLAMRIQDTSKQEYGANTTDIYLQFTKALRKAKNARILQESN